MDCLPPTILRKEGDEYSVIDTTTIIGEGKYIGLYFSAHWCPPCRAFTPALSKWYTEFKATHPNFELIFVSSDRDEKSYNEYCSEMPFPAMAFKDQSFKVKLAQKCGVAGIPTLAILDGATGDVITTKGRDKIIADPEGKDFPWRPKPLADALAGPVLTKGAAVDFKELTAGKITALYFSASWCGPCRQVTPLLSKVYEDLKGEGKNFEAVFVSMDRTEKDFDAYREKMPWAALPFEDARKELLEDTFEIQGIPTLVLLDEEGKPYNEDGLSAIFGGGQFPWK